MLIPKIFGKRASADANGSYGRGYGSSLAKIIFCENIRKFICIDFSDQNFMLILIAIGKSASVDEKRSYGRGHGCGHGPWSLKFFPHQKF